MFTSIKRAPYQSLGSFMILFFTLFLALFFFTTTSFVYGVLSYVETRPQVIAYFNADTEESTILQIKEELENNEKTRQVKYVSQKEALQIYKEFNSDNPTLLEMVSENTLPASLEIYAQKPEYLADLAQSLESKDSVDDIVFQKSIIDRLITLTRVVRQVSVGVFIFLIVMTVTVLITTTAFKISQKKTEIELLRLLGATKWYIRWPFLKEGVFFGFASGTTAFAFFYGLLFYFNPFISSYLSGLPKLSFFALSSYNLFVYPPSLEFILLSYCGIIFFGIGIGLVGNYLSTSKYIK